MSTLKGAFHTNETFYTDTKEIININDKRDYRRNYDMQYTENQAQHFGWKMTSDFIGKYYGKNNSFFNKAVEYANMHYLKELFDKKYNIIGRKFYTGDYINKNLNKYFKNNPEKLKNVYSNFTMFYDEKGNPKPLMSILSNYPIKEEYSEFYYSYYLGRVIKGESLEKSKLQELNIVELETLKNNFIKLLNMSYKKLELINKYINSKMIIKNIGKSTLVNNARVIYGISKRAYDSLMYLNKTYIGFITYDEMSLINDTYNKINCNEVINLLGLNNREGKHYGRKL